MVGWPAHSKFLLEGIAVSTRRDFIIEALQELQPLHLEVLNESDQHAGPPGRESHFRLRIVSDAFEGKSRVQRHRLVNGLLQSLLVPGGVHALALEAYTPAQWQERQGVGITSPDCAGVRKV